MFMVECLKDPLLNPVLCLLVAVSVLLLDLVIVACYG